MDATDRTLAALAAEWDEISGRRGRNPFSGARTRRVAFCRAHGGAAADDACSLWAPGHPCPGPTDPPPPSASRAELASWLHFRLERETGLTARTTPEDGDLLGDEGASFTAASERLLDAVERARVGA